LKLINDQALFKYWLKVSHKCDDFVGFYFPTSCRVAPTDHTGLYVWGLTLSEVMILFHSNYWVTPIDHAKVVEAKSQINFKDNKL